MYSREGNQNLARSPETISPEKISRVLEALGRRSIVLFGMRRAGKTTIGRELAVRLRLPFVDADTEIEIASAGGDLTEIVKLHGEPYLRAGEERVIARLLKQEPQVLVISDEGFLSAIIRAEIRANAISIWLRWDQGTVVTRRTELIFAEAAFTIGVGARKSDSIVEEILDILSNLDSLETPQDETVDRTNWTFGRLLNWHLQRGTRPTRGVAREWSLEEFASNTGVSKRAVRNWIVQQNVPSNVATIERVLFGSDPRFHNLRAELRERYNHSLEARESRKTVELDGERIRRRMDEMALTISAMVVRARLSEQTFRRALRREVVSLDVALRISQALRLPLSDILTSERGYDPPPAEAIPNAEPLAIQFTSAASGAIDLSSATEPGEKLQQGAGRSEDYAEVRLKASDLSALGSNRLGRASGPIGRFLSLPEDINQVRAKLFWSRANTLRILWQDHVRATADRVRGGEPDERLLEASAASQLKDLVETVNVFAVGDPLLMDLDAVRPGPQEDEAAREEVSILAPVVEDVIASPEIASARAREVVSEQLSNVGAPSDSLASRQANDFARRSFRNFVGELLRRAYGPVRSLSRVTKAETGNLWKGIREGAYRATGAALLSDAAGFTNFSGAFVQFVARHAEALSAYVVKAFQNPTLVEIIRWIVRLGG